MRCLNGATSCNPCYNGYQKQCNMKLFEQLTVVILAIMDIKNNQKANVKASVTVVILAIMDIKNNRIWVGVMPCAVVILAIMDIKNNC